jgi:hypothetical protein
MASFAGKAEVTLSNLSSPTAGRYAAEFLKYLIAQVFIELIDAASAAHRQWREIQDASDNRNWALGFKLEVQAALSE